MLQLVARKQAFLDEVSAEANFFRGSFAPRQIDQSVAKRDRYLDLAVGHRDGSGLPPELEHLQDLGEGDNAEVSAEPGTSSSPDPLSALT